MTVAKLVPLIGLALAGAAYVFLGDEEEASAASSSTKPTTKPAPAQKDPDAAKPGAGAVPPSAIVQRVMTALATMDPVKIRAEANKLEAEGFKAQADDLRKAADLLASGAATAPPNTTPVPAPPPVVVVPPISVTSPGLPSIPGVPASPVPQAVAPGKVRAATLALHLKNRTKGSEDKKQVEAFQVVEAIDPVDGLYGTATGLVIAERYGIVPPKPFYFGTKVGGFASFTKDKAEWKKRMQALAKGDPQRADEWIAVGNV